MSKLSPAHNGATCAICATGLFSCSLDCVESTLNEECHTCRLGAVAAQAHVPEDGSTEPMARRRAFCAAHLDPTKDCEVVTRITIRHEPIAAVASVLLEQRFASL